MNQELKSEIKDKVIDFFIDKYISVSETVRALQTENDIIKTNLLNSLKYIQLLKAQYHYTFPFPKYNYSLQKEKPSVRETVVKLSQITMNSLKRLPPKTILQFHKAINRPTLKYERCNSDLSEKIKEKKKKFTKELNKSSESLKENIKQPLSTVNSFKYFTPSVCNIYTTACSARGERNVKKQKKRDYSMPKLSLDKLLRGSKYV